jgi:hypothetical protein
MGIMTTVLSTIIAAISCGFSSPAEVCYDFQTDLNNDGSVTMADAVIAARQCEDERVFESVLASESDTINILVNGTRDRIYERFGAHEEFANVSSATDALQFYLESGSQLDYAVERCYSISDGNCGGHIISAAYPNDNWNFNYVGYGISYPAGSVILTEFVYDLRVFEETGEIDLALIDRYDFWLV